MSIALHFNVLDYIEKAEKLGIPNAIAKFQAREMESLYTVTLDEVKKEIKDEILGKEFATKLDIKELKLDIKELEVHIEKYRYDSLKFIVWTGCGVAIVVLGGMFTILKIMLHI